MAALTLTNDMTLHVRNRANTCLQYSANKLIYIALTTSSEVDTLIRLQILHENRSHSGTIPCDMSDAGMTRVSPQTFGSRYLPSKMTNYTQISLFVTVLTRI